MATSVGSLYYDLTLNDAQFRAGLEGAKAQAAVFTGSLSDMGAGLNKAAGAFMPLSIAAGAALGTSVKVADQFEQSMLMVHTQAGASSQEVANLTDKVMALAPTVGQGPVALANALFFIESAGFRGATAMDVLKLAAEGAAVGQASLTDTANVLTSAMNSQIDGAQTATEAMGNLNAIVGAGKMHFQDLNAAMSTGILSTAKSFGISLDSVGAAIADMTNKGTPAIDAANRLRMAMTLMSAPTANTAKVLNAVGLTSQEVTASTQGMTDLLAKAHITFNNLGSDLQQPDGFNVALTDLKTHLDDAGIHGQQATDVLARAFGGGRTSGPILQMIGDLNGLGSTYDNIKKTSGDFNNSWQEQQKTSKQRLDDFKASLEDLQVHLGNDVIPTLTTVSKEISGIADSFGKLSPQNQQAIVNLLIVALLMAPVLKILGTAATVLSALGTALDLLAVGFVILGAPIEVAAVLAVAALALIGVAAYLLLTNWNAVVKGITAGAKIVADVMLGVVSAATGNFSQAGKYFQMAGSDWMDATASGVKNNSPKVENATTGAVNKAVGGMYAALPSAMAAGGSLANAHAKGIDNGNPVAAAAGHSAASTTVTALLGGMPGATSAGQQLMTAHAGGVSSMAPLVVKASSDVGAASKQSLLNHQSGFQWVGSQLIQSMIQGIVGMAGPAGAAIQTVMNAMAKYLPKSPAQEGPFSGKGWTLYSGQALIYGLAEGITGSMDVVRRAMATIPSLTLSTPSGALSAAQGTLSNNVSPAAASATAGNSRHSGAGTTINNYFDLKGIMASSKSDLKMVARQLIDAYNEDLKAAGRTQIVRPT